jgi:hypothetical protein
MAKGIVQIGDAHIGHKTALMHLTKHKPEDYKPNAAQRWLSKTYHNEFLPDVDRIFTKYNVDHVHLDLMGDMGEKDHKNRNPHEVWAKREDHAVKNALAVLNPLIEKADTVRSVRGTLAHIGNDGGLDEMIAQDCDKIITKTKGVYSEWFWEYILEGVHFETRHHGRNRTKWTTVNGLTSLSVEIFLKRSERGEPVPDVSSFAHFHYSEHANWDRKPYPYIIAVPSWQLPSTFVYRIDPTIETPHVGGHVLIVEDEEILLSKRLRYFVPRSKPCRKTSP